MHTTRIEWVDYDVRHRLVAGITLVSTIVLAVSAGFSRVFAERMFDEWEWLGTGIFGGAGLTIIGCVLLLAFIANALLFLLNNRRTAMFLSLLIFLFIFWFYVPVIAVNGRVIINVLSHGWVT